MKVVVVEEWVWPVIKLMDQDRAVIISVYQAHAKTETSGRSSCNVQYFVSLEVT